MIYECIVCGLYYDKYRLTLLHLINAHGVPGDKADLFINKRKGEYLVRFVDDYDDYYDNGVVN
jgi:hypothetical protein